MNIKFRLYVFLLLSVFLYSSLSADDLKKEGERESLKIKKLFESERWGELEQLFEEARQKNLKFRYGFPILASYYHGLDVETFYKDKDSDDKWEAWYQKFEKWEKEYPSSVTLPVVRIQFWTDYAWKARGGGYAHTVKRDSWKLFSERLEKADEIFKLHVEKAGEALYPCPIFYDAAVTIALGSSWDIEKINELILDPTIKRYPDYYLTYSAIAHTQQPKWGGVKGGDFLVMQDIAKKIGGDLGKEVYARVILKRAYNNIASYPYQYVDRDMFLEGCLLAVKASPESSSFIEAVISFSFRYDAQKEMVTEIEKVAPEAIKTFYNESLYGKSIARFRKDKEGLLEFVNYLSPRGALACHRNWSVAIDPIDHRLWASFGDLGVRCLSLDGAGVGEGLSSFGRSIARVRISPDGNTLLTNSYVDSSRGFDDIELTVYKRQVEEIKEKAVNKESQSQRGFFSRLFGMPKNQEINGVSNTWRKWQTQNFKLRYIAGLVYTLDSKKVIFSHNGPYANLNTKQRKRYSSSEIYVWDLDDAESEPELIYTSKLPDDRNRFFTLSGDGKTLFFTDRRVYSMNLSSDEYETKRLNGSNYLERERVRGMLMWEKENLILAITEVNKEKYLVSLSPGTGDVLSRKLISHLDNDALYLELVNNSKGEDLLVMSGVSSSITAWKITRDKQGVIFDYHSTSPVHNIISTYLQKYVDGNGEKYLLQGTKTGKVGLFKVK